MSPAKQVTLEAVRSLPETSTMDDVLDKVNLVAQVLEGLEDAEAGRLLSTEQLLKKVDEWGTCVHGARDLERVFRDDWDV